MLPVVLKNSNYRKLLLGMTISKLGDAFFLIALPLFIYQLTKSPIYMASSYAIGILPQIIFSLIGGVLADRISKIKILFYGDLFSALLICLIPLLYQAELLEIWMIYAVIFSLSSISAFYHPSFETIVPQILEPEQYTQGNSLFRLAETIVNIAGPSLAGILLTIFSFTQILYIDCISFVISAILVVQIRLKSVQAQASHPNLLLAIWEGLSYVYTKRPILIGTLILLCMNVGIGAIEALFMFYLKDELHLSPSSIGLIFSLQTIGSLIAVYLANRWNQYPRGKMIIFCGIVIGASQMMLIIGNSWLVLLILFRMIALGAATLVAINWFTFRQEVVPSELLGRVISSTRMVSFLALPISGMIAGTLATWTSVPTIFMFVGGFVFVSCLLAIPTSFFGVTSRSLNTFSHVQTQSKPPTENAK